jgi:Sulfotransferase family
MLIFDHIPKTGGTTFYTSYVTQAFSPDEVLVVLDNDRESEHERFGRMTHQERSRFRVVAGHQMEFAREVEPQASFFSIVRDPVKRVTSAYLHLLYHVDGDPSRSATPDMNVLPDLGEFAGNDRFCFRNLQSAVLLGSREQSLSDKEIEQRIANRYAIVGITEQYDRLMFYLHRRLGVPLCLFNRQLVRRERSFLQIDPLTAEIIRHNNAMDLRVYGIACQLFDTQFGALMTPTDSKIFHLYAECLDLFRTITNHGPYKNVCLTKGPISLSDISEYHDMLVTINSGQTNYSDLVTKCTTRNPTSL